MALSYNEYYNGRTGLMVGLERLLFSEQTPYQRVEVFETDTWGNLMTIDGMVMLSERDEFVYHEMLTHVGLFSHPAPERVLIIGGGDGGSAREVMRNPAVKHVDMVEIDEAVVRAAKLHLPEVGDFDNPKLTVHYKDGIQFIKDVQQPYEMIIIDGSDPVGPAEGLFQKEFYESCYQALTNDGVLTVQTESPWVESYHPSIRQVYTSLDDIFQHARMYLVYIPLYPTGMWSMMYAGKEYDPLSDQTMNRADKGFKDWGGKLKYYTPEVHQGAFALPGFVRSIIED